MIIKDCIVYEDEINNVDSDRKLVIRGNAFSSNPEQYYAVNK